MKCMFRMIGTCPCRASSLPVLFSSILFFSIIASFVIAVARSDITPWFPAISDTGTRSPESNIFSQLLNISAFIGLFTMYIRYLQVKRDVEWLEGGRRTVVLNRYSLGTGIIAVIGSSVVANFPETQVLTVHLIGAMLLFLFGNIYLWIQVVISFHMKKLGVIGLGVCIVRLVLVILSSISLVITTVLIHISGKKHGSLSNLYWHSDEPGFKEHVAGDAFEWLMVFSFLVSFLTFTKEFGQTGLQIRLVSYETSYNPIPAPQSEHLEV